MCKNIRSYRLEKNFLRKERREEERKSFPFYHKLLSRILTFTLSMKLKVSVKWMFERRSSTRYFPRAVTSKSTAEQTSRIYRLLRSLARVFLFADLRTQQTRISRQDGFPLRLRWFPAIQQRPTYKPHKRWNRGQRRQQTLVFPRVLSSSISTTHSISGDRGGEHRSSVGSSLNFLRTDVKKEKGGTQEGKKDRDVEHCTKYCFRSLANTVFRLNLTFVNSLTIVLRSIF